MVGVDLLDFWRGTLSIRRLMVLIKHLPRESALVQAISPEAAWGATEHILADLVDHVAAASFKNPKPYPRPADRSREQRAAQSRADRLERQNRRLNAMRKGAT